MLDQSIITYHPQIETLRGLVCDEYGPWSRAKKLTQRRINRFGKATGDDQWLHTDPQRAKNEGPFDSTFAQGMLIESFIATLLKKDLTTLQRACAIVLYAGRQSNVTNRVLAGQALQARCRVASVEPKLRTARVFVRYQIRLTDGKHIAEGTLKFSCIARE